MPLADSSHIDLDRRKMLSVVKTQLPGETAARLEKDHRSLEK